VKKQNLLLLLLIPSYFITRLINLNVIPIFTDEAIYSFWAQVALHDPANRFISLVDGKQPLFIWLAAVFQKFIPDPLIATRMVSVFAGCGSVVGIYLLSKTLFNKHVAIIASILYIIMPFTLLYDRLALYDSLLAMFGIYAVLFSVLIARYLRLDLAFLNGFVIGFALITKSSAEFFIYLLPFSLIFAKFNKKNFKEKFIKWILLTLVTVILAEAMYNSLRLSPLFYIIARKNLSFIRTFPEVISNPFQFSASNFKSLLQWLIGYLSLPLFIILILSSIYGLVKKNLTIFYLLIVISVPFFAEVIFNTVLYPRFILFYFPYIIITISFFIFELFKIFSRYKNLLSIGLILILLLPIYSSYKLLTDPVNSTIPKDDSNQFLNDWPSGYGVKEVTAYLKEQSKSQKIYVATEGTFGLLPYALQIYFYGQTNPKVDGYWPVDTDNLPQKVLDIARTQKTYLIFNENQKEIKSSHLNFIVKYKKGIGGTYLRLYEITP